MQPTGPNALTRDAGWQLLCEWTKGDALRNHARAVEVVMRAAAGRYGGAGASAEAGGSADAGAKAGIVELFGLAGMLHDADYEQWPQEHPRRIVAWLRERNEEALAHAISAHYTKWNVPYESTLDKALLACDELTGFIGACCLVRPGGITTLEPKSVLKKLKDKGFAAKVERDEIAAGVQMLGVELAEHVQFVIDALKPVGGELGLVG